MLFQATTTPARVRKQTENKKKEQKMSKGPEK
jgi:hypothetical protein